MAFNSFEIAEKITSLGKYRTGHAPGAAFSICRPLGKKRKFDGALRWEVVGKVSIADVQDIGRTSPNLLVAAERAIARALKQPDPHEVSASQVQVQIDAVEVQRRVDEGVEKGVAKALEALGISKENVALLHTLQVAKRGRRKKVVATPDPA